MPLITTLSGMVLAKSRMAIPSEPESGPMMKSTLSCSTSLRAIRTVVSGLVSVGATTVSIFLPAMVLFTCLRASSTLRTPSAPPVAKAPSSATRMPILMVPLWARAEPGSRRAASAAAPSRDSRIVVPPSDAEGSIRSHAGPSHARILARPRTRLPRNLPPKAETADIQASHFRRTTVVAPGGPGGYTIGVSPRSSSRRRAERGSD